MYSCKDCALPTGNIAWNEPDGHICISCKVERQQSEISLLTRRLAILQQGLEEIREFHHLSIEPASDFANGYNACVDDVAALANKTLKEAEECK